MFLSPNSIPTFIEKYIQQMPNTRLYANMSTSQGSLPVKNNFFLLDIFHKGGGEGAQTTPTGFGVWGWFFRLSFRHFPKTGGGVNLLIWKLPQGCPKAVGGGGSLGKCPKRKQFFYGKTSLLSWSTSLIFPAYQASPAQDERPAPDRQDGSAGLQ